MVYGRPGDVILICSIVGLVMVDTMTSLVLVDVIINHIAQHVKVVVQQESRKVVKVVRSRIDRPLQITTMDVA